MQLRSQFKFYLTAMTTPGVVGAVFGAVGIILSIVAWRLRVYSQKKAARENDRRPQVIRRQRPPNQQEDIFNISSRVQGQGQWPTHDTHVSLENFTITNEINKYNDAPPTYEEAMHIAASNNNNAVVPAVAPKTTVAPTSTSATTPN